MFIRFHEDVLNIVYEYGFDPEAIERIKALGYLFYKNQAGNYKFFDKRMARVVMQQLIRTVSGTCSTERKNPQKDLEHFCNLDNHLEINPENLKQWLLSYYGDEGFILIPLQYRNKMLRLLDVE